MILLQKIIKKCKYSDFPYLECFIIGTTVAVSFACLMALSRATDIVHNGMQTSTIVWILFVSFFLSVAIAILSVMAGIGGGIIFTPVMLAFTDINSLLVRGTGIIVAMSSGAVSAGIFTKKGLSNYRLNLVMILCLGLGAFLGAELAIHTAIGTGVMGEGALRLALGCILLALVIFFLSGGKKMTSPKVEHVDKLTRFLKLEGRYYEEGEKEIRNYKVKRAPLGMVLLFLIGILGGFFGMGGGWAITPALNIGMGLPLRVAAASSNVILGVGGSMSVWPYIFAGAVIPLFTLPWLAGQVVGGFIGAHALTRVKVDFVRIILIGVMVFTSFTLVTKGLEMLGFIREIPAFVQVILFILIMLGAAMIAFRERRRNNG